MMKKRYKAFVVSHHLVERIYDMLIYFDFFKNRTESEYILKEKINSKMNNIYYIEACLLYTSPSPRD